MQSSPIKLLIFDEWAEPCGR